VTWIVTEPLEKLAIHHRLRRATVIDAGSLAGRKSLNHVMFIALGVTRSIYMGASVNLRVAGPPAVASAKVGFESSLRSQIFREFL
jgi:hypothetical protein